MKLYELCDNSGVVKKCMCVGCGSGFGKGKMGGCGIKG